MRCRVTPATSSSISSRPFAYAQRCDQHVRVRAPVGDASFSGVFLGACSTCPARAYARCARRPAAGELRVLGDRRVDGLLRGALACARIDMRMHCTDQRDLDGDRARSGLQGAAATSHRTIWARVRRSWCRSWSCAMRSRAVVRRPPRASGSGVAPVRERSFCVAPRSASGQRHLFVRASSRWPARRGIGIVCLSRLAPPCENLHRAGHTGHPHQCTPPDLRRSRRAFGLWERRAGVRPLLQPHVAGHADGCPAPSATTSKAGSEATSPGCGCTGATPGVASRWWVWRRAVQAASPPAATRMAATASPIW